MQNLMNVIERAIKGWNFMKVRNVFNLVLSTINRFLLITFAGIIVGRYTLRVPVKDKQ